MTSLQELMMNAYQQNQMEQIKAAMAQRMQTNKDSGIDTNNLYGQMQLNQMIANATQQRNPGSIMNMSDTENDVGGSIWDMFK